jgi:O-antigen/teichoic acid export membrane protein
MLGRRRAAFVSLISSYAGLGLAFVKGIILVPLYFRYFSLSAYGAWLASANIVALLGLIDLGLGTVFYQRLAEAYGAKDIGRFVRVSGCVLAITLITTPVVAAMGAIAAPFVPGLVNADATIHKPLMLTFALTAAASALDLAQTNVIAIAHAWQRTGIGGTTRIIVQIVEIVGTVVSLRLGLGIIAFGVGSLAGALVGTTYSTVFIGHAWRRLGLPFPTFDRREFRELMSASVPVFLSRIVGHVASNIDVALMSAFVSPAAAGVYGLTDRLFRFAASFVNPIAGSVLSALAHLFGEVGAKGLSRPLRDLFVLWSSAAALLFPALLAINRDFVTLWVGADKYGGLGLSMAICLSTLLSARSFLMYIVLAALGEIALTSWVSAVEPILRIPLMVLGLSLLGPIGLPIATTIGMIILSVGFYPMRMAGKIQLGRTAGIMLQMRGVSALIATMALGAMLAAFAPSVHHWPTLFAKSALISISLIAAALATSSDVRELTSSLLYRMRQRIASIGG